MGIRLAAERREKLVATKHRANMCKKNIGSDFDDLLAEEAKPEVTTTTAVKRASPGR
jgi:hypothetical protein